MKIRVVNVSNNPLPEYASDGAAGLDLRAFLNEPVVMKPLQRVLVPTGIRLELPAGFEAQVRSRSGLAIKNGIAVLNSPGTVDSDYRGEIKVILVNLSDADFVVHNGDRIAQLVVARYERIDFQLVEELTKTERNEGGFGSSGL
ncbi:MAG: dUTP diphosphatase [Bacteroidales bacterium]|nr:dUTP diphosphatase [Bacteroidales bacterium]